MKTTLSISAVLTAAAVSFATAGDFFLFPFLPRLPSHLPRLPEPPPVLAGSLIASQRVVIPPAHQEFSFSTASTWTDTETVTITQPESASFEVFDAELSHHGSWMRHDEYGMVWQPYEARQDGWRPYCHDGRWIWTEAGWYWHSGYSWGHIPFHYGRWVVITPLGWVWVPGYTWAPSWVHWRYSSSHCGWAPLPPGADFDAGWGFSYRGRHVSFDFNFGLDADHYVFVPSSRFMEPAPCEYRVPGHQVTTVYQNTTIIYNDYRTYNDRTVYTGLPPSAVCPQGREPQPRPVIRGTRQDMQEGGRLSRILDSPGSSQPSGRTERIVNAASRSGTAQAAQPVPAASRPVSQAPAQPAAQPGNGRVSRITSVRPSAPASAPKAAVSTPSRAQAPAPASSGKQSNSRVARVRALYESHGR